MTCDTCAPLLDDFVDDALPPEARAGVRAHLAACGDCRTLAGDLATIRSLARALPPFVPPARVWHAVVQQTQAAPARRPLAVLVAVWRPAVAAAMSIVLVTGLAWLGGRLTAMTTPMPSGRDTATGASGAVAHHAAEVSYSRAIASLETLADAQRSSLQPAVAEALDSGMSVIDAAIDQSREALRAVPNSEVAEASLLQAMRTKVMLLQDALALATDRATDTAERR